MHRIAGNVRMWFALVGTVFIFLAVQTGESDGVSSGAAPTPTPYHEGVPVASPHAMAPSLYPLPSPEDRASANAMAAGGAVMVRAAKVMDEAATVMLGSNDPPLVDLGRHWALDAQALRQQAAWMVLSATAADMVHDPATAHEINARNLKGNGMAMAAEGKSMADHGRAMMAQVKQLQQSGMLSAGLADQLMAAGQDLIATGEDLERDGQRMQDTAEQMLRLIGQ